jgi:NAD-dependent dihydropyrimidine dehydrogenase PreA subunit
MNQPTHHPRHNHFGTEFIKLDSHKCQACWKCVETCPNHVLGKVTFLKHRHARVDHAEACKGCQKCVRACPNAAISYLYTPLLHAMNHGSDNLPTMTAKME